MAGDAILPPSFIAVLKRGLIYAAMYHAVMLILLFAFFFHHGVRDLSTLRSRFTAWDGNTYIYLANHGYVTTGDEANYIVFYPLYPFLIRVVSFVIPFPAFVAVAITILSSLVGHALLYVYFHDSGLLRRSGMKILFLLFVSPMAIYFSAICTEGLFLLLTAALLVSMQRKWYWAAICCGFLACLTRFLGVVFVPFVAIAMLEQEKWKRIPKEFIGIPLIAAGFGLYLLLNWSMFGSFFYYQKILEQNWFKHPVNPVKQYVSTFKSTWHELPKITETFPVDTIANLAVPFIVIAYIAIARKQMWISGVVWTLGCWLIIISQSFWLSSMRYIGLIIPLYVMIERITRIHLVLYLAVFLGFLALSVWGISIFSTGGWVY